MPQQDFRARLQPKSMNNSLSVLGPPEASNILFPLHSTRGVLFPYTPAVTTGNVAEYDPMTFTHANYGYNAYIKSAPRPISITAEFTAQSNPEALYLLAVLHFFRSITKSYFGIQTYAQSGTPPPTLIFNYLGQFQFNNVPVVVKSFDYTLPADIDYVPINTTFLFLSQQTDDLGIGAPLTGDGGFTYVPTHLTVQLELDTQYIPIKIRNDFNLNDFRSGKMVGQGYI
jgi:hypothetical protein